MYTLVHSDDALHCSEALHPKGLRGDSSTQLQDFPAGRMPSILGTVPRRGRQDAVLSDLSSREMTDFVGLHPPHQKLFSFTENYLKEIKLKKYVHTPQPTPQPPGVHLPCDRRIRFLVPRTRSSQRTYAGGSLACVLITKQVWGTGLEPPGCQSLRRADTSQMLFLSGSGKTVEPLHKCHHGKISV